MLNKLVGELVNKLVNELMNRLVDDHRWPTGTRDITSNVLYGCQRPGFLRKVHHGCKPLFEVARWTPITVAKVTTYRHWGCTSKYGDTQVDEWILLHWGCLSTVILNFNFGNSLDIRAVVTRYHDGMLIAKLMVKAFSPTLQDSKLWVISRTSELSLRVDSGVFTHLPDVIGESHHHNVSRSQIICAAKNHFQLRCWDEEMQEESVPKHVFLNCHSFP